MLTNFRYKNFLVTINGDGHVEATRCISISEAKRRNRKTRWPERREYKFPQNAWITHDNHKTPRTEC